MPKKAVSKVALLYVLLPNLFNWHCFLFLLQGGTLILKDEAINDDFLHLIMQQEWNIQRFELRGVAINVTNEKLCQFIAKQNALCEIRIFRVTVG